MLYNRKKSSNIMKINKIKAKAKMVERIKDTNQKKRISFYGHPTRVSLLRLSNRLLFYVLNRKTKGSWFSEEERYLLEI